MQDKDDILDEIFNNDPLGLLKVKPKVAPTTADDRLVASFEEINDFIKTHDREPTPNKSNITEYKLYARLKGIRENPDQMMALDPLDVYEALKKETKEINSIEDIFSTDSFDALMSDDSDLFDFNHVPKETAMPDYIAKRKPCKDFDQFEHLFIKCHKDLSTSKRRIDTFKNEQQIDKGYFFVLKGIVLYVADIGKRELDKNKKTNARLRVIFENGTESDLLLRSLAAELYKNGRRISEHQDRLLDNLQAVDKEDVDTGYIYVLKSLSTDPKITSIEHLYKIGYSTIPVEERIKNAHKETTYLMAPVYLISSWRCLNRPSQKFEQLIHNFFGKACLNIDIYDEKGRRHSPREWFVAPINVVEEVVELIVSGEILNYTYDINNLTIIPK